jgi:hypothetical protein
MPDRHHRQLRLVIATSVIALFTAVSAPADEFDPAGAGIDVPAPAAPEAATGGFRPSEAELAESDWLRMNSGEWVKGRIKSLRDGSLEFSSADLGGLKIGFGNIAELHSPHPNRYVFEGRDVFVGPATMQGDTITVRVAGQPQGFPRSQLIAILEGERRERNFWNFGAGFGLTGRSGNTDSLDLAGSAYGKRETARTRWNTAYRGAFAELEGVENTNNHLALTRFDWFLTPRLYLIPLRFEFFNDEFKNIRYRVTPSAGLGYQLFKRGSITWDVSSTFGYQHTRYETGGNDGSFVMVLGTGFETAITKYLDYDLQYTVNLGIPDVNLTTHHAETGLSFDIWGPLDFDVDLIWDRIEDPVPDADGNTPKKDDLRLIVGLGVDF